jgi:hypothetical protein
MIELLKYIFSSFWIFCGTVILITLIGSFLVAIAGCFGLGNKANKYLEDDKK